MAIFSTGAMMGPIIGPTLGGWLTENFDWRWCFYINLPVGALCALGVFAFIRPSRPTLRDQFDMFGFAMLSLGVGSLQLMLDRGQIKDWFHSTEIWVEATTAALCFYLLIVHTMTAGERSFLNRELLKSPNFVAGSLLMFGVGMILTGTLALVPSMMQVLLNYPVFDAGWMMAPRGFGTMLAMFIVARMINRFDNRLHLCAAQPLGIVGPAAPHPDPGNRIARADAHARRQHRHRDPRNRAQPKHADRPLPPDGAPAPGQPAGPAALPLGPVQPDRPLGDRCAQPRSHPPSRDDRLQRRFRLDADRHPRLIAVIAAGPRPAPTVAARGSGRLARADRPRAPMRRPSAPKTCSEVDNRLTGLKGWTRPFSVTQLRIPNGSSCPIWVIH